MTTSEIREIPIGHGRVVLVDASDYDYLSRFRWTAVRVTGGKWYARTRIGGQTVYMHRALAGWRAVDPLTGRSRALGEVDHINGDGLDNRRCNLRCTTHARNIQNSVGRPAGRKGPYKGVSYVRSGSNAGKWRATIEVDGRQHHLGYFRSSEAAAQAYDRAAALYFGEFARLNFPCMAA